MESGDMTVHVAIFQRATQAQGRGHDDAGKTIQKGTGVVELEPVQKIPC